MAEGNSIQQTNPALVEWAGRISLDQIPGLLLFLAARWLTETNAKAKEENGPPDSAENLLTAGDLAKHLHLPESCANRGAAGSNTKRQARQIRPIQIERGRMDDRSKKAPKAIKCPIFLPFPETGCRLRHHASRVVRTPMASIKKFHVASCSGKDCSCLWVLDYRPLGLFGPCRRVRFKTRKEAERFLTDTLHKASRGDYLEPTKVPIFGDVAEEWFKSKLDRRPSHLFDLRTRLDKQILPVFGKEKLDRITVAAVEKLRDRLREAKYAHRTINRILWIIGSVFRLAIKRGQYSKNPVDSVERAVQPARELKPEEATVGLGTDAIDPDSVLNPKEIQTLLREANPGFERTLFETAHLTGAREGELLALRWTDLELPKDGAGKMAIRRSLSWARPQGEEIRPR